MTKDEERMLREKINQELAGYGQRLRRTSIVQEFSEDPMMRPLRTPRVVERNVDLEALAARLGVKV
jgi:hypothetical protein